MSKLTVKAVNPFYIVLVVVGALFTVTACSYFVMTLKAAQNPVETHKAIESGEGFLAVMDRNGQTILIFELVVLALATVAAIASDGFWKRLAEKNAGKTGDRSEKPTREEKPANPFTTE